MTWTFEKGKMTQHVNNDKMQGLKFHKQWSLGSVGRQAHFLDSLGLVAQLVRAFDSHSRGRRFESSRVHKNEETIHIRPNA